MPENVEMKNEINVLDILLIVVEYWVLILFVPLVVAIVTFFIMSNGAEEYSGSAKILAPAPQVEALLQSHTELAEYRNGFNVSGDATGSTIVTFRATSAQSVLEKLSSFAVAASAELFTERSLPLEATLATLEARVDDLETLAEETKSVSIRLQKEEPLDGQALASLLQLLQILQTERFQAENEVRGVQDALSQLRNGADFVPVSTPTKIKGSNPYILSGLAGLGAGLAMLLLAFLHYGVRRAASDPDNAAKLHRLMKAFVFWRTKSS